MDQPARTCRLSHRAFLAGLVASLLTLTGCGSKDESAQLASTRENLAKKNPEAARIQLKSLLQQNPVSGEGRFLLGQLMYHAGEMPAAEAELRRALEAGHPEAVVLPVLADTLLSLGKGRLLVQQYGQVELADSLANHRLKIALAEAELADGDLDAASVLTRQVLARDASHPAALLLSARLSAARGDSAGGLALVGKLLERVPGDAPAWAFKGDLLHRTAGSDAAAAVAAWRQSLALEPRNAVVQASVITALIDQQDFDAANRQWAEFKKALPRHPQTAYFEAVLALQRGESARARDIAQQLLQATPNSPRVLLLAGQAALQLGLLPQAEQHLSKVVQLTPKAALPRRLLAKALLSEGQADKALAVLRPLLEAKPPDTAALTLAAQASMVLGDSKAAEGHFTRAAALQPNNPKLHTALAMSQAARSQDRAGLDSLRQIAAADAGSDADLALINAHLRRNDTAGALKAVAVMAAKLPGDPLPNQLSGRISQQQHDHAAARKQYEQALAKSPNYLPALISLGSLDLAAQQPAAARARFETALQRNPGLIGAMLALAELNSRTGGSAEESQRWLDRAVSQAPTDPRPRLLLIDHLLAARQAKLALAAAQAGVNALPDNIDLLDRLGRVQLLNGDTQQAVSTFNRLAVLQPKSPVPQLRLAQAYAMDKSRSGTAAAVKRALELAPNDLPALYAGANLALMEGRPTQALALARKMQAAQPDNPAGLLTEGEVELRQKNLDGAAAAFRKASTKAQPADSAQRLYTVMREAGKAVEADKWADEWRKSHPNDMPFVLMLGDTALAGNQLPQAESLYRTVVARQPKQVTALNNLAYVLALQRKPGAVATAEQALLVVPDSPLLMDTLALALASEQQLPRAITVQTRVVAMAPKSPQYRLQLAKLLLQAGDKVRARQELDALAKLGTGFTRHAEVADLLRSSGS